MAAALFIFGRLSATKALRRAASVTALWLIGIAAVYGQVRLPASDPGASVVQEVFTAEDGLPVNHARGLYQTPDGYLWAATFDGLTRFDGVRFTVFDAANTAGLPSSRLHRIKAGLNTGFWLMTEQGHLVHRREDGFTTFGPDPFYFSAEIYADGDSVLWIGGEGGRLLQHRDSVLVPVADTLQTSGAITAILRDSTGALWVGTSSGALWRLDGEHWHRFNRGDSLGIAPVGALFEEPGGTLLIGGRGLARYHDGRLVRDAGIAFAPRTGTGEPWVVEDLYREPEGPLWLATTGGLFRYENGVLLVLDGTPQVPRYIEDVFAACPDGGVWMRHGPNLYRGSRVVSTVRTKINDLICDRENNVWISTDGSGLHRFRTPFFHVYSETEGLGFRNVYGIYEDRRGGIWAGAMTPPLVSRLRAGALRPYGSKDRLRGSTAAFLEQRDGTFWVGSNRCHFEHRTEDGWCTRFEPVPPLPIDVRALHERRDGSLWAGTADGLYRFSDGRWSHLESADRLSNKLVRFFLEAPDGTLWMATNGGGVLRYTEGSFSALTTADGLSSNNIRALHLDGAGVLWIGSEDRGLNRLDPRTGRIVVYRQADGLYDEGVHAILEDDAGRLWMSTNTGIFWARRDELEAFARGETDRIHSVAYTERHGMRNREGNGGFQNSGLTASDGRLWFATQDGAVVVEPSMVRSYPLSVVVEEVATPQGRVPVRGHDGLDLDADERSFSVRYTAPSFVTPERVLFRYRLDGYDAGWIDANQRREVFYTRVPPGRYTFRVMASHGDGVWSEAAFPLGLTVAPFFYETWWFLGLCGLALVGVVLAGHRIRTRQLRQRQRALQALVASRTEELRREKEKTEAMAERLLELDHTKSRFFANISHEFRTPLTLTIGPLEDLLTEETSSGGVRARIELALGNARRLLQLINRLLDLSKLESGRMQLDPVNGDLVGFTRKVVLAFEPLAERRHIQLSFSSGTGTLPVSFDPDKLEQVLANLLSNAFKFTPECGSVRVTLRLRKGDAETPWQAEIAVRDSGIGISPDQLPHIFDRFYQAEGGFNHPQKGTGIGLALARDLVLLHGGAIRVESEPGFGSTFFVTLPADPAGPHDFPTADHTPRLYRQVTGGGRGDGLWPEPDGVDGPTAHVTPVTASLDVDEDRVTILVVDDNPDIRGYLRSILGAQYRVVEASGGSEGLALARSHLPDLVLADVMMPGTDGYQLCEAIKVDPALSTIPVLLLTAKASDSSEIEGLGRGADDYITKPFNRDVLLARIDNVIQSRLRLRTQYQQALHAMPRNVGTPLSSDEVFLEQVRAAAEANLHDGAFSVEAFAAQVGLSRAQFYRKLQALTGMAPSTYLRRARLERAAHLLAHQAGTVGEIAYGVGFNSLSHFSRCFSDHFGILPSEYHAPTSVSDGE